MQSIGQNTSIKEVSKSYVNQKVSTENENIKYLGWIKSNLTYKYISIADLAIYPGRHSVLWEQTAGQGIPCVIKYWPGTTHIDVGGNCMFLYENSEIEMKNLILSRENKISKTA